MTILSRRRFLQIGAGAAGAGAAAAFTPGTPAWADFFGPAQPGDRIETVPTFCDICFWKCGAIATVRDGRLWKIEGNPDDPLSRGRLCPRGTGGVGRPLRPRPPPRAPPAQRASAARRSGSRSPGTRRSATSPRRCRRSRPSTAPRRWRSSATASAAPSSSTRCKAYGTPNIAAPSFAQCRGPRDVGFELTFGEEVGSPERTDIRNARCLVLIGSHLGENMHNTPGAGVRRGDRQRAPRSSSSTRASRSRRARRSTTCRSSPGTDIALLLAWMNVLVARGALRPGLRRRRTASASRPSRPRSRRSRRSGPTRRPAIEPEVIRETAREMARHRPATLVHPGRHATWYGDDAQRSRAIALLNALLGSWGRKGGFYQPASMDVPALSLPALPEAGARQGRQSRTAAIPFAERGPHHRHPRGDDHRPALPDQGLVRLRHEPDPGAAEPGGDDPGHPDARPAGRGGRMPQRDRRLGRRRAARVDLPRALRRPQRRDVPRAVRRAAPAGGGAARRPEARTGGSPASWR